jgi:hypothetical protein
MKPDKKTRRDKKLELRRVTITQLRGVHGGCLGDISLKGCTGCNDESNFSCRKASCL